MRLERKVKIASLGVQMPRSSKTSVTRFFSRSRCVHFPIAQRSRIFASAEGARELCQRNRENLKRRDSEDGKERQKSWKWKEVLEECV